MEYYSHPRIVTALYRNYQKLLRENLADLPVNPATADYLRVISMNPGITLVELAQLLRVSAPAVAQVLSSLEKGGYIERVVNEDDRRAKRIYLSEKGKEIAGPLNAVFDSLIERSFDALSDEENEELKRLLTKLLVSLDEERDPDNYQGL